MSILGTIGGALGGLALGAVGQGISSAFGLNASREAYSKSESMYKHRYRHTMHDMRSAGLNPILAATGGFNVSGSPQMHAPNVGAFDAGSSSARNVAETDAVESKIQKNMAEAKESLERAVKVRIESKVATQKEKQLIAEIYLTWQKVYKIGYEQQKVKADVGVSKQRLVVLQKQCQVLAAGLEQLNNVASVYRSPVGKVMTWLHEWMETFNLRLAGSSSSSSSAIEHLH